MGYEVPDLPSWGRQLNPIETCMTPCCQENSAVVPIPRRSLNGKRILALVPSAKVGHIGLYRERRGNPSAPRILLQASKPDWTAYDCGDWSDACNRRLSAVEAVDFIKQHGGRGTIKFMVIIAAPEGLLSNAFMKLPSDVQILRGTCDRRLNENAYICSAHWRCRETDFRNKIRRTYWTVTWTFAQVLTLYKKAFWAKDNHSLRSGPYSAYEYLQKRFYL